MSSTGAFAAPSGGGGRWAVVAALPEEVGPIWRRLSAPRRARSVAVKARTGELAGRSVVVVATGDGVARATRGVAEVLDGPPIEGLIAIGIAGGLSPDLVVGDLVAARVVTSEAGEVASSDPELLDAAVCLPTVVAGRVFTHTEIAVDPVAKERLWRACGREPRTVVDLESASYARASSRRAVPFLVLRAVSDSHDEALPLDFNRFRRSDGSSDRFRVLRHTLMHPSITSELLQLRERLRYCAERLAESVEEVLGR